MFCFSALPYFHTSWVTSSKFLWVTNLSNTPETTKNCPNGSLYSPNSTIRPLYQRKWSPKSKISSSSTGKTILCWRLNRKTTRGSCPNCRIRQLNRFTWITYSVTFCIFSRISFSQFSWMAEEFASITTSYAYFWLNSWIYWSQGSTKKLMALFKISFKKFMKCFLSPKVAFWSATGFSMTFSIPNQWIQKKSKQLLEILHVSIIRSQNSYMRLRTR